MSQYPGSKIIQCTLDRQKPVKAAVIVFGHSLWVIQDPQLVTETEAAVTLTNELFKIGVISVYFEGDKCVEENLVTVTKQMGSLHTENLIVGGDLNAWSHWWGSVKEDSRGQACTAFFNDSNLNILNQGDTPTFEVYRNNQLCTSIVDVTACSTSLLAGMDSWKVNKHLITSDHNAITFNLRTETALKPISAPTTRRFNTKHAHWSEYVQIFSTKLAEANLTREAVEEIETREDLERVVSTYTTTIQLSCTVCTSIPKVGEWNAKYRPPWWSKTLEQQKAEVLRRKRRIKNAAPHRRLHVYQEYKTQKESYKKLVTEAQTRSWKEFCTTQERESMWDGIYRVIRRTARREEDVLLRGADGSTLDPEKSAALLANTFYPEDSVSTDKPYHATLREQVVDKSHMQELLSTDDPPFREAELELVLQAQSPKKAPGPDGLTADICAWSIRADGGVFLAIANKCLSLRYFPRSWKMAHVIILKKPGKEDYTHPKSYRPIGLLSILGKTVEKLLVGRLQYYLLPTLHPKQYGFVPQRGTEDALCHLLGHLRSEIAKGLIVIMVSLDIEGAFDNAWWPALKHQLQIKKIPGNLYATVDSYLQDRKVVVNYSGATSERYTNKGCVQGSIGGPTFWNIILDPLLHTLTGMGVYCQAFADDVVLVFSGTAIKPVENSVNETLKAVTLWGCQNKLTFAAHKTNVMLMTRKLKYDPPVLYMSGKLLNLVEEIKVLGLVIDRRLTFKQHISAVCKKSADIYKQLAYAAKVTWGLNGEIIRTIYVAVIEPIVTYAASAWYQAAEAKGILDRLKSLQRGFAQKICKAYRTVSLTAAIVLSGTLPLDLKIREVALLYQAKRGLSVDYIPSDERLERRVSHQEHPHPSEFVEVHFELLESLDSESKETHHITGPCLYTDGSKVEGKVGAALTWWDQDKEIRKYTYSLHPSCTVFQSELFALSRAVEMARDSQEKEINIMSDSRSSLELLTYPKPYHPLAKSIQEEIKHLSAEGTRVRLFWIRAHKGTAGNERADELAKSGARQGGTPDYDRIPVSYVKKKIREESVRKWQDRYDSSCTGTVTKTFLPDVTKAYCLVRGEKLTPLHIQMLTGHGGMGEYLHRFRLKDSPGCVCDPEAAESVWHLLLECPRFGSRRMECEIKIGTALVKDQLHAILADKSSRPYLLEFMENIITVALKNNSTLNKQSQTTTIPSAQGSQTITPLSVNTNINSTTNIQTTSISVTTQPSSNITSVLQQQGPLHKPRIEDFNILSHGQIGQPGLRIRAVALFMDNNAERVGIAFCNSQVSTTFVSISPGLAKLLKGSTSKTSIRKHVFNTFASARVCGIECKVVRERNKNIVLLDMGDENNAFAKACKILQVLSGAKTDENHPPKRISMDVMSVDYLAGEVKDYWGTVLISEHHEIVVYEGRGKNLSFLKPHRFDPDEPPLPPIDCRGHPVPTEEGLSGSERLQRENARKKEEAEEKRKRNTNKPTSQTTFLRTLTKATHINTSQTTTNKTPPSTSKCPTQTQQPARTRADQGMVDLPVLREPKEARDHWINAFLEFRAITEANLKLNEINCKKILQVYKLGIGTLLKETLENEKAALYNAMTDTLIAGSMSGAYMAAYSGTSGLIANDEKQAKGAGRPKFNTPPNDPVVVVAESMRIILDDRILSQAKSLAEGPDGSALFDKWTLPRITWTNGVPGCGKTTYILQNFSKEEDMVITWMKKATDELREKLEPLIGDAKARVRTMASVLVNGLKSDFKPKHLIVDEAPMNHFGSIVMATQLTGASRLTLVGDINQLPFIDRNNLLHMSYIRPTHMASISRELLCTHRNPQDVPYALQDVYSGIYTSQTATRSLLLKRYGGEGTVPKTVNTLYLTYTQAEKASLIEQGYGELEESCVLTVHESQGLTRENVVIVRSEIKKLGLYSSIPHTVVAISRHTGSCTYYCSTFEDDATANAILKAAGATEGEIRDYNLMMAIRNRDKLIVEKFFQHNQQQPNS